MGRELDSPTIFAYPRHVYVSVQSAEQARLLQRVGKGIGRLECHMPPEPPGEAWLEDAWAFGGVSVQVQTAVRRLILLWVAAGRCST